jgi:hypothetical protein
MASSKFASEVRNDLKERIRLFSPSKEAMRKPKDENEKDMHYRLTRWQKDHHLKIIRNTRDWQRVAREFIEGVKQTRLLTIDVERDVHGPKDSRGKEPLRLLLAGSLVGSFLIFDLDDLWPSRRRDEKTLEECLPQDFVKLLRDKSILIVGSGVDEDYAAVFPGESPVDRFVEVTSLCRVLYEAGVMPDASDKPGLGNVALLLVGFDHKTYTCNAWTNRGYPEDMWDDFRLFYRMYAWKRDLRSYQLFYCYMDIAIPLILAMRVLDHYLAQHGDIEVTPDLLRDCFKDNISGMTFSASVGWQSISNSGFADARAFCAEEREFEEWRRHRDRSATVSHDGLGGQGAVAGPSTRPVDEGEVLVLHASKEDKVLHDEAEHERWKREKKLALKKMSLWKLRQRMPHHPAMWKQPLFDGVCWACGKFKKDCDIDHPKLKCLYPLCRPIKGDNVQHDTSVCRSLQSVCNRCLVRGHREGQCGRDGKTFERKEERREIFEDFANLGRLTKERHSNPYVGFFYFGRRNGFKNLAKPDKTYWQMRSMSVEHVEQWIKNYVFPANVEHRAQAEAARKKRELQAKQRGRVTKRPRPDRSQAERMKKYYASCFK